MKQLINQTDCDVVRDELCSDESILSLHVTPSSMIEETEPPPSIGETHPPSSTEGTEPLSSTEGTEPPSSIKGIQPPSSRNRTYIEN